jgi:Flp pilus assembly protein TadG
MQRGAWSEEGSAIMETAMSSIILLTFMFGVIETGFALYSYHFVSEAAREGSRYAMVRGSSAGSACANYSSSACQASTSDIQNYVKNLGFPGIDPGQMTVTVTNAGYPAGVVCSPSASCNNPGNMVTVKVDYSFPLTVPFVPAHTYTLSSTAAMIIQN